MSDEVQCAKCGFLTAMHIESRQLLPAEPLLRDHGSLPQRSVNYLAVPIYEDSPVCYKQKFNLREEIQTPANDERRKACVQKERHCDTFIKWHPGLTPQEHSQMSMVLEAQQKAREAEQRESAFREATEARLKEWRDDDVARQDKLEANVDRRHQATLLVQFWLAILAAAITLIASKFLPWFSGPQP